LLGLSALARGGAVRVEASVATEVLLESVPVVRTYGPGTVTLPELPAGQHSFEVFRGGRAELITVDVPDQGEVRLLIGEAALTTDAAPTAPDPAVGPRVLLKAVAGQRFGLVIDGKRAGELHPEQPLRLDSLKAGVHKVELRSVDHLTVWARGELDLRAGDDLAITVQEGKLPEAFGRAGAWTAK
jgi:hypothetical protein